MKEQTIKCPHCGKDIELTEVLTHQIRASMRAELESELGKREQEFAAKQAALKQKEKELLAAKETLDEQVNEKVAQQVKADRQKIAEQERQKLAAETGQELKSLKEELNQTSQKMLLLQKQEIELRKNNRQLEQKQQEMELENQRKLDADRKKIADEAAKKVEESNALKMREKDDQLAALNRQIDELKRRAETRSQEAQGEALEGNLKDRLAQTFAADIVEDVKKGARGADLVQRVRNHQLKECGSILWEAKNAQNFSREWIAKLKSDQQEAGADVAVLATVTLPKEIDMFGMVDDVWVTDYKNAVCLSMALRHGLINVAREKLVAANQGTVKDVVYRYVTGPEFGMQVRSMVGAFKRMQEDLDSEKRAMQKYWKSREKQIETLVGGVTNIYAAVEGYVGHKALPEIDPLMLESGGKE